MEKKSKRTNKRKVSKRNYRKKNKKTRKIHKRKMMKGGSEGSEDLIRQFMEYTKLNEEQAVIKLTEAEGDIDLAKALFLSEQGQGPEKKSTKLDPIQILRALIPELNSDLRAKVYLEYPGVNYDIQKAEKLYKKDQYIGMGAAGGVAKAPGGAAKAARAPLVVIGTTGLFLDNRNMLELSYEEHISGKTVGYLIAGNAGIVGGGLMDKRRAPNADPRWNIDCRDKKRGELPQEEGSFINFCCATRGHNRGKDKYFFDRMKAADRVWGMIDLTGKNHLTKQGVDYTKGDNFTFKYERCVYVGNLYGYSQKGLKSNLEEWDENKSSPCKVFITAGPQARNPDTEFRSPKSSTSTMRRTYDHNANIDDDYLINSIRAAYIGSLREMDSQDVTVAIVPGLSTGVYAPPSKQDFIKRAIPQIIAEAIGTVSPKNIKKVIYCHPDN